MTFKEKLVKLRKLKGITQDEFASAVGVSRQAVYKWESGQSYPEVSKLLEMKLLFGISIDDLLDDNYEVIVPEKKKRKRASKPQESAAVESVEPATVIEAITPPVDAEAEILSSNEISEELPADDVAPLEDAVDDESKKKPGFFGRLFGRK